MWQLPCRLLDGTINVWVCACDNHSKGIREQKGPMNYSQCGFVSQPQYGIYYLVIKWTRYKSTKHIWTHTHTHRWKWLCKQIKTEIGCRFIVKCRSVCVLLVVLCKMEKCSRFTWIRSYWQSLVLRMKFLWQTKLFRIEQLCAHLSLAFRVFFHCSFSGVTILLNFPLLLHLHSRWLNVIF